MQRKYFIIFSLIFTLAFFFPNCSTEIGNPDTEEDFYVEGMAYKGPMSQSRINIYQLNADGSKGDLIAQTETDNDGYFRIYQNLEGYFFVESLGGSYQDEATSELIQVSQEDGFSGIVYLNSSKRRIVVSPLSTLAVGRIKKFLSFGIENAIIFTYYSLFEDLDLNLEDADTNFPSNLSDPDSSQDSLNQKRYGAAMAAFSQLMKNSQFNSSEFFSLLRDLQEDYQDGNFNGNNDSDPIDSSTGFNLGGFANIYINARQEFLNSSKNLSGYHDE